MNNSRIARFARSAAGLVRKWRSVQNAQAQHGAEYLSKSMTVRSVTASGVRAAFTKAKWPLLAYAGYVVGLTLLQKRLVFNPTQVSCESLAPANTHESALVSLPLSDGGALRGWLLRPQQARASAPAILYFGGRTEDVSWLKGVSSWFPSHAILALNYRGYGDSDGEPTEKGLLQDGLAQYEWLAGQVGVDPAAITLIGRSLGTGVACYVAAHRPAARVVLITPYDSLVAVARRRFRFTPMALILRHKFDSIRYAQNARQPVLALLAEHDDIVPADHTYRLLSAWKGVTALAQIPGTDHINVPSQPATLATVAAWLGYAPAPIALRAGAPSALEAQFLTANRSKWSHRIAAAYSGIADKAVHAFRKNVKGGSGH